VTFAELVSPNAFPHLLSLFFFFVMHPNARLDWAINGLSLDTQVSFFVLDSSRALD
jgi:hypothetical protein